MTEFPLPHTVEPTADHHLSDVVSSVVDDVVKDAVFAAELQKEKRTVQNLINDLVTRVQDNTASPPNERSSSPVSTPVPTAVPTPTISVGDHRARRLPDSSIVWAQTMDSATLTMSVPPWVRKHHVNITFSPGAIKLIVCQSAADPPVLQINNPLAAAIDVDACMWALEDSANGRALVLELEKQPVRWWPRLFMADDPSLYELVSVRPERTTDSPTPPVEQSKTIPECSPNDHQDVTHVEEIDATGLEDPPSPDASLEDTVADFVSGVISAADPERAENQSQGAMTHNPSSEEESEIFPNREQRPLTRADLPRIVEQCKETLKKGGPVASEAALQLATFYHHGIGVDRDDAEAARLYTYALENGCLDPSAAFQLGLIYNQGATNLKADSAEAVRWWTLSARLGNSVAMFNLGVMAMNGSGCDMDPIVATQWFQQAQALNPQLQPPQFSRSQLEERISTAIKLKKEKLRRALPPEEKERRKQIALQKVRVAGYTSAAILGLSISVIAIRYWWRNSL